MSKKFSPPSPEELELQAAKIGLPQREAQKFFNYYESKGWMVGKSPMKIWRSALANWKLKWEESRPSSMQRTWTAGTVSLDCGPDPNFDA